MTTHFRPRQANIIRAMILVTSLVTVVAGDDSSMSDIFRDIERRPEFITVRRDGITLLSDLDTDRAQSVIVEINATRRRVQESLKWIGIDPNPQETDPLKVIGFSQSNDYKTFANRIDPNVAASAGVHGPNSGVTMFHIPTSTGPSDSVAEEAWKLVVRHETVHQIIHRRSPELTSKLPWWLSEGLACCFETGSTNKTINRWRAADFCATTDPKQLIDTLDQLWLTKPIAKPQAHDYAVAWAMTYYLTSEHSVALSNYFRKLQSSPSTADARALFQQTIFTIDSKTTARILTNVRRIACPSANGE